MSLRSRSPMIGAELTHIFKSTVVDIFTASGYSGTLLVAEKLPKIYAALFMRGPIIWCEARAFCPSEQWDIPFT